MEKIKLPKDVTYAITVMRANGMNNFAIINSLNGMTWVSGYGCEIEDVIQANETLFNYVISDNNGYEKIIQALVNGYEFELTPEEKVKQLYDDKVAESVLNNATSDEKWFACGALFGIKQTLKYLGIKIEGI